MSAPTPILDLLSLFDDTSRPSSDGAELPFNVRRTEMRVRISTASLPDTQSQTDLSGAMDFDVTGAGLQMRLRELLSKQISNEMIKAIKSNIRE